MTWSIRIVCISYLLIACGGSVVTSGTGTAGAGTTGGAGGNGAGASGGGAGGSSNKACYSAADCRVSEWCDLQGHCKNPPSAGGACRARPSGCPLLFAPSCGCDGKFYENDCVAQGAGVDIDLDGSCRSEGYVACGAHPCDAKQSFCRVLPNDVASPGEVENYSSCQKLPQECEGKTDCACFATNKDICQGYTCKYDQGFRIGCRGG